MGNNQEEKATNSKKMQKPTHKPLPEDIEDQPELRKLVERVEEKPHPLDTSNWLSILFLTYINPIINLSKKITPTDRCHYKLPKYDSVEQTKTDIGKHFYNGHSIMGSFFRAYPCMIFVSIFVSTFLTFTMFFVVFITKICLEEIDKQLTENGGKLSDKNKVFAYLMVIVGYNVMEDLVQNWIWVERNRLTNRLTGGVYGIVYDKILKIGIVNPHEHDEGSIVNYLQTDIAKFDGSIWGIDATIDSTLKIVLSIGMGVYFFKMQFLVLFAALVVVGILNSIIFKFWFQAEDRWSSATDKRINELKNILKNIKFIKINALENVFFKRLNVKRQAEISYILVCTAMSSLYKLVSPMGGSAAIVIFLYFYFNSNGVLDVSTATILLRIFNLLQTSMIMLPAGFSLLGDLFVSIRRLDAFLGSKELEFDRVRAEMNLASEKAIEIKNGYFFWDKKVSKEEVRKQEQERKQFVKKKQQMEKKLAKERKKMQKKNQKSGKVQDTRNASISDTSSMTLDADSQLKQSLLTNATFNSQVTEEFRFGLANPAQTQEKKFRLQGLNFEAKRGDLTAIIGKIGSGKSSLLYAALGEMRVGDFAKTSVHINDKICYLAQTPWLINGCVKDNILLDKEFNPELFDWALKYSALEEDVRSWHKGVMHMIGDEGTALSGGQRIRVALARCLYQE